MIGRNESVARLGAWSLAAVLATTAACKEDAAPPPPPLPPDPAPFSCGEPKLEPVTSVHEHPVDAPGAIPVMLETMNKLGIHRATMLPLLETDYYEQAKLQLTASLEHPDRLVSFMAVDPFDKDAIDRIEAHMAAGGGGVKLYNGHGEFYEKGGLDGPEAEALYQRLEEMQVPVLMHVNGGVHEAKFRGILTRHPRLVVLCPHFCLTLKKPGRLHALLNDFPNLYTDVSFGRFTFLAAGMSEISKNAAAIRALVRHHRHRFVFGTDTSFKSTDKPEHWAELSGLYKQFLEKDEYDLKGTKYRGLKLDPCTLESLYRINPERFLRGEMPLSANAAAL